MSNFFWQNGKNDARRWILNASVTREKLSLALQEELDNLASWNTWALDEAKSYTDQKISDLTWTAPGILDTLWELANALKNEDWTFLTNVASELNAKIEQAKQELKDWVSESFDTLKEIETALNTITWDVNTEWSILKAVADSEARTDSKINTTKTELNNSILIVNSKINTEITARENAISWVNNTIVTKEEAMLALISKIEPRFLEKTFANWDANEIVPTTNTFDNIFHFQIESMSWRANLDYKLEWDKIVIYDKDTNVPLTSEQIEWTYVKVVYNWDVYVVSLKVASEEFSWELAPAATWTYTMTTNLEFDEVVAWWFGWSETQWWWYATYNSWSFWTISSNWVTFDYNVMDFYKVNYIRFQLTVRTNWVEETIYWAEHLVTQP